MVDAQTVPIPDDLKVIHALNRLSLGPGPDDVDRVKRIGVERYIHEQLHPESIPVPDRLVESIAGFETLTMSPVALYLKYWSMPTKADQAAAQTGADTTAVQQLRRKVLVQAVGARMMRAIEGPRQLQEVLADFWFNHFNVFAGKGLDRIWVGAYEQQAIRPHTLGRFRDLLGATAKHPAMLFYLDNWQNTAPGSPGARGKQEGINENYARELMELHTLGVDGGYTQQDVIALARILTGWGLPRPGDQLRRLRARRRGWLRMFEYPEPERASLQLNRDGFVFDAGRHDFGDKVFLGRTITGSGIAEGEQALDILARSPATARHLSLKLAQYFVADDPPPTLVSTLAGRFEDTDGDIRAVLTTLFASDEFWQKRYYAVKFKTPYQFVISAARGAGARPRNLRALYAAMAQLGMPVYGCPTPDGYKNTQDAWLNPDAMMRRLDFAIALGTGRLQLEAPPPGDGGEAMGIARRPAIANEPVDAAILAATLGGHFSEQTASALEAAAEPMRSAVILGSPEFMRR
jgi:uncharacterized protein (DUF1800 family)